TRTKLVAYVILAFLALGLAILGGILALSGWGQRDFNRKSYPTILEQPNALSLELALAYTR
ncbi:MAG: hypothetical protein ACM3SR_15335, partial [Ignavibacteriales bacterium]